MLFKITLWIVIMCAWIVLSAPFAPYPWWLPLGALIVAAIIVSDWYGYIGPVTWFYRWLDERKSTG